MDGITVEPKTLLFLMLAQEKAREKALPWLKALAIPVFSGALAMYGAQVGVEKEIGYLKAALVRIEIEHKAEISRVDIEQKATAERQRGALLNAEKVHTRTDALLDEIMRRERQTRK